MLTPMCPDDFDEVQHFINSLINPNEIQLSAKRISQEEVEGLFKYDFPTNECSELITASIQVLGLVYNWKVLQKMAKDGSLLRLIHFWDSRRNTDKLRFATEFMATSGQK